VRTCATAKTLSNRPTALERRPEMGCEADDILDAFVGLWTAERVALGVEWPCRL
jgi:hypothetical protein